MLCPVLFLCSGGKSVSEFAQANSQAMLSIAQVFTNPVGGKASAGHLSRAYFTFPGSTCRVRASELTSCPVGSQVQNPVGGKSMKEREYLAPFVCLGRFEQHRRTEFQGVKLASSSARVFTSLRADSQAARRTPSVRRAAAIT